MPQWSLRCGSPLDSAATSSETLCVNIGTIRYKRLCGVIDECKKYVVAGGKHEGSDRQFSSGSARLPLYFDGFVAAMESRGFLGFRYIEPTVLDFQSDLAAFGRSAVMQVGRVGRVGLQTGQRCAL